MRDIAYTIKLLRLERMMTQQQLADALQIKKSTLSMYELGKRIPPDEVKEAICDYFNVDMNFLFGLTSVRNSYRENVEFFNTEKDTLREKINSVALELNEDQLREVLNFASYTATRDNKK